MSIGLAPSVVSPAGHLGYLVLLYDAHRLCSSAPRDLSVEELAQELWEEKQEAERRGPWSQVDADLR
jgi:hypothetical protein